jgi:hydrogenase expression/formation protein HypD
MKQLSLQPNIISLFLHDFSITDFGKRTLAQFKSADISIRIIESPIEIIKFARKQKEFQFYLFAAGFDPLTAIVAATILAAQHENLNNLLFFTELYHSSSFIPILYAKQKEPFDGIFIPGHIIAPLGYEIYENLVRQSAVPIIITGIEVPDVLQSVSMLLAQLEQKITKLEVQYRPGIRPLGNPMARQKIESIFEFEDVTLPDLGIIPQGRFVVKKEYLQYISI